MTLKQQCEIFGSIGFAVGVLKGISADGLNANASAATREAISKLHSALEALRHEPVTD